MKKTQGRKLKIRPSPQWDGHTCGLRASSSIYKFYGLSPRTLRLRDRLGTDHALPFWFPKRETIEPWLGGVDALTAGTAPMDMFAVLYEDGFNFRVMRSGYRHCREALEAHIRRGHPALCLLYAYFHWVVVSGYDRDGVWIVDSIPNEDDSWSGYPWPRIYRLPHDLFATLEYGLVLVRRRKSARFRQTTHRDYIREYGKGLAFIARAAGRRLPRALGLIGAA